MKIIIEKDKKEKGAAAFTPWCETVFSHHGCGSKLLATAASPSAGPISTKSAIFIKNATIFVAKHTKNLVKNGTWQIT